VRMLFAVHAASRGKPSSGDKTTGNARAFGLLADLFPRARFLHMLRDPREVCMSLALQPWQRDGLAGAAMTWRDHVGRARAAARRLGTRVLEVRYERLVARPEAELERVCAFLGLPFEPAMLAYPSSPERLRSSAGTRADERLRPGVRRWREELSRDDVSLIELVAGPLMDDVGYSRLLDRPTSRARIALARVELARVGARLASRAAPAPESRVRSCA
jgi:hypothetical protein